MISNLVAVGIIAILAMIIVRVGPIEDPNPLKRIESTTLPVIPESYDLQPVLHSSQLNSTIEIRAGE